MAKSQQADTEHEQAKKKKETNRRFVLIAVLVAIALYAGLIAIAIWHPHLNERVKFGTETSLGLAVLFAVVAQIIVSRWQWEVMEDTLRQSKETAQRDQRAYVFISDAKLASPISSGDFPRPNVCLKNSGKTPAYKQRLRFEHAFLSGEDDKKAREGIMPPMRPLGGVGHAVGPGEFTTIHGPYPQQTWKSTEERDSAMRGLSTYHIWGLICYDDAFDEEHAYKFSLYARNQTVTDLSWGRFGNDREEKGCEKAQASN